MTAAETIREASAVADKVLSELESLRRLRRLLEDAVDTVDGPDGEALPNAASQILTDWAFREFADHNKYV